jgi:GAF domain-containing protein
MKKKRSKAKSKPGKARAAKALKPQGRSSPKTPKSPPRHRAAPARYAEVARLARERDEALEQQAAISDILRVISNSPSDVQPVLDAVAQHAARICEAQIVDISIVADQVSRIAASFGKLGRQSSQEFLPLDRSTVTGRSICDLKPIHVADVQNANDEFPLGRELAIKFGHRSILSVPLIREDRALGAILVRRTEVRPFEEKHITLLKAFADQAAIAIEKRAVVHSGAAANARTIRIAGTTDRDLGGPPGHQQRCRRS